MLYLYISGHDFRFEAENVCRLFFPHARIKTVYDPPPEGAEIISAVREWSGKTAYLIADIKLKTKNGAQRVTREVKNNAANYERECELGLAAALFSALAKPPPFPPWTIA